jgi:uncharacterized protein YwgA
MSKMTQLLKGVLEAADGEIVGRIRMQKVIYLLQQLGLESRLPFTYHHYGPYSEELTAALSQAEVLDKSIREERREIASFGGSFSIFTLTQRGGEPPRYLGKLPFESVKSHIQKMKRRSSVDIELAATIHWLREKEKVSDWRAELKFRKPTKATDAAIHRALELLKELDLEK